MFPTLPFSPEQPLSKLCDPESRQIFTDIYDNISLTAEARPPKSVLICSANQQEGATTVAIGVAMAAAEHQAEPVLLVDGNFHCPGVCRAFGLAEHFTGLGDLITGRASASNAVRKTMMAKLWIMGSGVAHSGYVKNLESPHIRGLMDKLAQEYALVIIDGPSIIAYPESVLCAAQVDRIFLVVRSGVTRVPVINRALAKLGAEQGNKVDIILNRRTFSIPSWIYKKL